MYASPARFQALSAEVSRAAPAPVSAPAGDPDAVETRGLLRAVWARRRLIFGLPVLVAVLVWLVMEQMAPTYTAYAKLMLDVRKAQIVARDEVVADVNPSEQVVNSEIAVLRSNTVIEEMLGRLTPAQRDQLDPALQPPSLTDRAKGFVKGLISAEPAPLSPEDEAEARRLRILDSVRGMRTAYAERDSFVMAVRVDAGDPALARDIANGLVDAYIDLQLDSRRNAVGQATVWLGQRLDELRLQVEDAERAVTEYRAAQLIEDGGTLDNITNQLTEMNSELALMRANRVEAEARLRQLQNALDGQRFEAAARLVDTPTVQELALQRLELQQRDSVWARSYDSEHPRRVAIRSQLTELRAALEAELQSAISVQRSEVIVAIDRAAGLEADIGELENQVLQISENQLGLRQLSRKAEAARQTYEALLLRTAEANAQKELQQPDAVLVDRATLPGAPSKPRPKLMAAMSFAVTAALLTAGAIFAEISPRTFRSAREIGAVTGLPVVTVLPKEGWTDARGMMAVLRGDGYSPFAESIRQIRAMLTRRETAADRTGRSVMFIASASGEGKTTLSLALAEMAVRSGRYAIVVDCDLRRPSVISTLGLKDVEGPDFADFILDNCTLPEAIHEPPGHGFDILAPRARNQAAVDALSVSWLAPVLRELERVYDYVIVDAPALLAVPDALVVAPEVRDRFFVVAHDDTLRDTVTRGLDMLSGHGIAVQGIVLNKSDPRSASEAYAGDYQYDT